MDIVAAELNSLLQPIWGSEKWINEGWKKLNAEERQDVQNRVATLFQHGMPFKCQHDKLLYIYVFSLMAQLEVLGIQLPLRFEDRIDNPILRQKMRAQLVDEVFHAIVFTKIVFELSAPYHFPPAYNEHIESICAFIRAIDCPKVGVVVMNLVCEGLVEEVFASLHDNNIAKDLFAIILADEHRHVSEADLYREIGLPDQETLAQNLNQLENLVISAFSLQPKYSVAFSTLLGPEAVVEFLQAANQKHHRQLKKINMVPSEKWEMAFFLWIELQNEFESQASQIHEVAQQEITIKDMSPTRQFLMSQLNSPGDPTMVVQFNLDISDFAYYEQPHPPELLTLLMMQAVSHLLATNEGLRDFLSMKELLSTKGAFVAFTDKLPACKEQISSICFRDSHEMSIEDLMKRIDKNQERMRYSYLKREQLEAEKPELKTYLKEWLANCSHDIYPFPTPGNNVVHVTNLGPYAYTQAKAPLLKNGLMHVLLLAVERKQVWSMENNAFVVKDFLPVSISADTRIFDGLLPIPQLLQTSFQTVLNQYRTAEPTKHNEAYEQLLTQLYSSLEAQKQVVSRAKILTYLMSKKIIIKEGKRIFGDDIELYGKKLSQYTNFNNIANQLVLDYLGFDAEEAMKNEQFNQAVDKMLKEDERLGYLALCCMQTLCCDFVDVETAFKELYQKIANSRLHKLVLN